MMGCIAYVRVSDKQTLHTCQMCNALPEINEHISINGVLYTVDDIVRDYTDGEESVTVYLK